MVRIKESLIQKAFRQAQAAQKRAYAPYSKYKVGASIICGNNIISGCNVENASYGATICAERTAATSAVSHGFRSWDGLVVVTSNAATPCALCLQILSEFCGPEFRIFIAHPKRIVAEVKLSQLLGFPFRKSDLKRQFDSAFHLRS